jgi:hypothetical protein
MREQKASRSQAVTILAAATFVGLSLAAMFFAASTSGEENCRESSWVDSGFLGASLATIVAGVITASAAYVVRRRQPSAGFGWAMVVGVVAPVVCVLLFFAEIVDWVGECTA